MKKTSHSPLNFINNSVKQVQFQKRFYLNGKLDFHHHLQNILKKVKKYVNTK